MDLRAFSLQTSRDHYAWIGTLDLADEGEFNALAVGSRLTMAVNPGPDAEGNERADEAWAWVVESLQREESGGSVRLLARVISPSALWAAPWHATIDQSWAATTNASVIAAAVVPGALWGLLDWPVAAGRFAVEQQTPLDALARLAEAVGGRVQSQPGGAIQCVPRVPYPPAIWPTAPVAARITDEDDIITRSGTGAAAAHFSRVTVTDGAGSTTVTPLAIELDDRPNSPNEGRTQFAGGETAHVRVWHVPGAEISLDATAGTLDLDDPASDWITETVEFRGAATGSLSKPAAGIGGVQWMGVAGGNLTLEDPTTISATAEITALALVTYSAHYRLGRITLPDNVNGAEDFEVMLTASTPDRTTHGVSVTVARGGVSGDTITDPLCCTPEAATARANSALDDAYRFTGYTIESVYLPGLMAGQLIECAETRSGDTWRGMIDSIEHRMEAGRLTTILDVLRA